MIDQALKLTPILFHELREAAPISNFYLALLVCNAKDMAERLEMLGDIHKTIVANVKEKRLSRKKLNAAYTLAGSPFRHPIRIWIERRYHILASRNVPKDGQGRAWKPSNTMDEKLKALWRGLPGEPM